MREKFESSSQEHLDRDKKLRDFVNQQILPFIDKEKLKSVIVYGSYTRDPQNARDVDILIIYDGNRNDLQHLSNRGGEFDVTVFDIGWVENDIVGRRDLSGYKVLYGQDLFKNLSWEKYERKK